VKVISAEFVTSAAAGGRIVGIPHDKLPQIAVAGRSNVGKSTLLNALCRRKIARTSAAPGKTRLANVFRVSVEGNGPGKWSFYLVDLPGYGYARGGADSAAELRAVAEAYFGARSAAREADRPDDDPGDGPGAEPATRRARPTGGALLLVDSRHPGLESDIQAARWLSSMHVDYRVVATKIDKLSRSERARNVKALELTFGMPPLAVSAGSGEGMDALWKTIASLARTGHA
jgi:GTP-binding protein